MIRFKNPYFWISIISVVLTSINVSPNMLTSWSVLILEIQKLFGNPFLLSTTIVAIIGTIHDPTTSGLGDCKEILNKTEL